MQAQHCIKRFKGDSSVIYLGITLPFNLPVLASNNTNSRYFPVILDVYTEFIIRVRANSKGVF
jgi:hypothetical protein